MANKLQNENTAAAQRSMILSDGKRFEILEILDYHWVLTHSTISAIDSALRNGRLLRFSRGLLLLLFLSSVALLSFFRFLISVLLLFGLLLVLPRLLLLLIRLLTAEVLFELLHLLLLDALEQRVRLMIGFRVRLQGERKF